MLTDKGQTYMLAKYNATQSGIHLSFSKVASVRGLYLENDKVKESRKVVYL